MPCETRYKSFQSKAAMKILIETIPYSKMRYPTVGDYFIKDGIVYIQVAKLGNWRYEACSIAHELVEFFVVKYQNIPLKKIDHFDDLFERKREEGNIDEPGDDPRAPYKTAHSVASGIERIVAAMLCVGWKKYSQKVDSL